MRHLKAAVVLASLSQATAAELPPLQAACSFQLPSTNGTSGCWLYDLASLPLINHNLTDDYPDSYVAVGPCQEVQGTAALCKTSRSGPAFQFNNDKCLLLGSPEHSTVQALGGDPAQGIRITYTDGDSVSCGSGARKVTYIMTCDAEEKGPDPKVGTPEGCTYEIVWRTPLACPTFDASATCQAKIPLPTAAQLRWQRHEIMALIHFNMATFFRDGDPGCDKDNWAASQKPASFAPAKLDPGNWVESMQALGAKHAVLTAKHGCGHLLWPTKVTLPDGSPYGYSVGTPDAFVQANVLQLFADACRKAGIGIGFYYSLTNNFYLNVHTHNVGPGPLLPGQQNVTQAEFEQIALGHVQELWTEFGNLTEIWFDGGYTGDMKVAITKLLEAQPEAVAFGGSGVSANPARWVGTESGLPKGPIWSTGCGEGGGDPEAEDWCPAGCDTTLQVFDHWFWEPDTPIRSVSTLIDVYHATVGQNGVLELDFAIDRDGRVDSNHAVAYKALGSWISQCYGTSVASTSGNGTSFDLTLPSATTIDRIVVQEDQQFGQRVREWKAEWSADGVTYAPLVSGQSIGNKAIAIAPSPVLASSLRLTVSSAVSTPVILYFGAYQPCAVPAS